MEKYQVSSTLHQFAIQKIEQFVGRMKAKGQSGSYYQERRAAAKPYDDIALGKLGEFYTAVYLWKTRNHPVLQPDLTIFDSYQKSYDIDLAYPDPLPSYHVKTCNAKTVSFCGQMSWCFHCSDPIVHQPQSKDHISLVYIPSINSTNFEIAVCPWSDVATKLKNPVARKFWGMKKCLYQEDIYDLEVMGSASVGNELSQMCG